MDWGPWNMLTEVLVRNQNFNEWNYNNKWMNVAAFDFLHGLSIRIIPNLEIIGKR